MSGSGRSHQQQLRRREDDDYLFANDYDAETENGDDEDDARNNLLALDDNDDNDDAPSILHMLCLYCCPCFSNDTQIGEPSSVQTAAAPYKRTYKGFPATLRSPLSASSNGGRSSRSNSEASILPYTSLTTSGAEVSRRIMLVGMRNSGKSSLVRRVADDIYDQEYLPTIETVVRTKIKIQDVTFVCDLVDTAGQNEDVNNMSTALARQAMLGVHGYILVFSLTSAQSLQQLQVIYAGLVDLIGMASSKCVLVGCKADCSAQRREVPRATAERLAAHWNIPYIECSSKTDTGVIEVFETLLKEMDAGELLQRSCTPPTPPPVMDHHTSTYLDLNDASFLSSSSRSKPLPATATVQQQVQPTTSPFANDDTHASVRQCIIS